MAKNLEGLGLRDSLYRQSDLKYKYIHGSQSTFENNPLYKIKFANRIAFEQKNQERREKLFLSQSGFKSIQEFQEEYDAAVDTTKNQKIIDDFNKVMTLKKSEIEATMNTIDAGNTNLSEVKKRTRAKKIRIDAIMKMAQDLVDNTFNIGAILENQNSLEIGNQIKKGEKAAQNILNYWNKKEKTGEERFIKDIPNLPPRFSVLSRALPGAKGNILGILGELKAYEVTNKLQSKLEGTKIIGRTIGGSENITDIALDIILPTGEKKTYGLSVKETSDITSDIKLKTSTIGTFERFYAKMGESESELKILKWFLINYQKNVGSTIGFSKNKTNPFMDKLNNMAVYSIGTSMDENLQTDFLIVNNQIIPKSFLFAQLNSNAFSGSLSLDKKKFEKDKYESAYINKKDENISITRDLEGHRDYLYTNESDFRDNSQSYSYASKFFNQYYQDALTIKMVFKVNLKDILRR